MYTNIDCHHVTRLNNPIAPILYEAKQIHMYICIYIRTFVQERKVLQMQNNIMLVNSSIFIFVKIIHCVRILLCNDNIVTRMLLT